MAEQEQKARAEGLTTQVESLLNRNPSLAKQTLENGRGLLQPQVYDQLVNRLRPMLSGDQTDEAIRLAKTLIRTARYGTLATIDNKTGAPNATRVGVGTDIDGAPIILISRLAAHTPALKC